jgi:hypothetical protein
MSATGLRLHLDRPSPVGVNERLTVVLGSPAGFVEVKARVVWARAESRGQDLGLEFTEPGSRTRAALFGLAWTGPDGPGPVASVGLSGIAV